MQDSLKMQRAIGSELDRPYCLALLAEALAKAGQVEGGLTALAEALEAAQSTGERYYEAELHRLQGELLLDQGAGRAEAKACFARALEMARRQGARSLELRAALSLARLYYNRGSDEEARDLLAPVYAWFTEGLDTRDLLDSKDLLDRLE